MFEPRNDAEHLGKVAQRFPLLVLRMPNVLAQLKDKALVAEARADGAAMICTPNKWRSIIATTGSEAGVTALITDLRTVSDAMMGDCEALKFDDAMMTKLGFRKVVRERFLQDLTKVPPTEPEHDGVEYV